MLAASTLDFIFNLTQSGVVWKEGLSTEELARSDLPVGMPARDYIG